MKRLGLAVISALALTAQGQSIQAQPGPTSAVVAKTLTGSPWRHVKTVAAVDRTDVSENFTHLAGFVTYNPDGTYDFYDLAGQSRGDKGTWQVSADGKMLTLQSLTFEYSKDLQVELTTDGHLHVTATHYAAGSGTGQALVEVFAASRQKMTSLR